jgi:hypothetical protein
MKNINECDECHTELEPYASNNHCQSCTDYLERESKKKLAIDKAMQIRYISAKVGDNLNLLTDDVVSQKRLSEITLKADEILKIIESI